MTQESIPGQPRAWAAMSILLIATTTGCWPEGPCEPPLSEEPTTVEDADLPDAWTRSDVNAFRIVLTTGPYRVSGFAVAHLSRIMRDQAGLEVEVVRGTDTGLPRTGVVKTDDVIAAGRAQIPPGDDAVAVIVVVSDTTFPDATYGFIAWQHEPRSTAVVGLHRAAAESFLGGLIPRQLVEALTLLHEIGHWLVVPARDFHTSAIDGTHCTNARCVMFKGSRLNLCAILANLKAGFPFLPLRFGPDCAAELAEMQRRRQVNP